MRAVHLLAGAALALTSVWAAAQDAPESLLPKMFDEPSPASTRTATPRPTQTRAPATAPRPTASASAAPGAPRTVATATPVVQAIPTGTPQLPPLAVAQQDDGTLARIPSLEELERMSPEDFEALLGAKVVIDMPPQARRSIAEAGLLDTQEGGLAPDSLAIQNGRLVQIALAGNRGTVVSRWGHILLRRALASRLQRRAG